MHPNVQSPFAFLRILDFGECLIWRVETSLFPDFWNLEKRRERGMICPCNVNS
jgi:hypothetical protein